MQRPLMLYVFVVSVCCLVGVGVIINYSVLPFTGGGRSPFVVQMIALALGFILCYAVSKVDLSYFKNGYLVFGIFVATVLLNFCVYLPYIGVPQFNAHRWIAVPGIGVQFQPSELMKVALILYLALRLSRQPERNREFLYGFVATLVIIGFAAGVIYMQRDLGTPALLGATGIFMMFVAGVRPLYLIITILMGVAAVIAAFLEAPYRVMRFFAFLDPWSYRDTEGYQLIQALMAIHRGGLFGVGVGAGEQKLGYLVAARNDFVFSAIGEELGVVGMVYVVLLFALLAWSALRLAPYASEPIGRLIITGCTMSLCFQAFGMMLVNVGSFITKGMPLPFISNGGSAVISAFLLVGLILSVARRSRSTEPSTRRTPLTPIRPQRHFAGLYPTSDASSPHGF